MRGLNTKNKTFFSLKFNEVFRYNRNFRVPFEIAMCVRNRGHQNISYKIDEKMFRLPV